MKIIEEHIESKILHRNMNYRVIRPSNPNGKSLYLLHGYSEDFSYFLQNTNIADWADQTGVTVIMPCAGDGYYVNYKEQMCRFIGEELVWEVQRTYHLSKEKDDTWIAGISMGGFGSLLIGSHYSKTFGKIGCVAGSFVIPSLVIWDFSVLGNKLSTRDYFLGCFGDFEQLIGSENDPEEAAVRAIEREELGLVYLFCGRQDKLYQNNKNLRNNLKEKGVSITWKEADGDHEWSCFKKGFDPMLQWLLKIQEER